jgi:hypothetical protein
VIIEIAGREIGLIDRYITRTAEVELGFCT